MSRIKNDKDYIITGVGDKINFGVYEIEANMPAFAQALENPIFITNNLGEAMDYVKKLKLAVD